MSEEGTIACEIVQLYTATGDLVTRAKIPFTNNNPLLRFKGRYFRRVLAARFVETEVLDIDPRSVFEVEEFGTF
jgi:hypothetical protein